MTTTRVTYEEAVRDNRVFKGKLARRVAVIMPAYNEAHSIFGTLKSLSELIVPSELKMDIFIALDNCTDNTEEVIIEANKEFGLNIYLYHTTNNQERKVGALNQLYHLFYGDKSSTLSKTVGTGMEAYKESVICYLSIDADVYLEKNCLMTLWTELQQKYNIGAVSANYTALYQKNRKELSKSDPERETKLRSGEYGGPINNWWVSQQNREFADFQLKSKRNGHVAKILGGQCSLFRREALEAVRDHSNLNGFYDNKTDTEDLLLTQQIRAVGFEAMISVSARCYVDAMKTLDTFNHQHSKWASGSLDYMLMDGLKTKFSRQLWLQELGLFTNLFIRLLMIVLIPLSLYFNQFEWSWLWISPFVLSAILNVITTFKTPNWRWVDVFTCAIGVSPEVYLWVNLYIHAKVWLQVFRQEKINGWDMQATAEQRARGINIGASEHAKGNGWLFFIITLTAVGGLFYIFEPWQMLHYLEPYISLGFNIMTVLTIIMMAVMLWKILQMRSKHKA